MEVMDASIEIRGLTVWTRGIYWDQGKDYRLPRGRYRGQEREDEHLEEERSVSQSI